MNSKNLTIRFATAEDWNSIETLFGKKGASNGCWCLYWLIGPEYKRRDRELNKIAFEKEVSHDMTGIIAYRDDVPVGWARFSRRSTLEYLMERFSSYNFSADDPMTLSCFYISSKARNTGVMTELINYACNWAKKNEEAIEAYPIDIEKRKVVTDAFTGALSTFLKAGFVELAPMAKNRPVVRFEK
ncbi:MAG: GNAT family N-acetyltransferase [Micrococcaceae bacterium]